MTLSIHQVVEAMTPFFDNLQTSIAIVDEKGIVLYYNRECMEVDGMAVEKPVGLPLTRVCPNFDPQTSSMLRALRGSVFIRHRQDYFNYHGRLVNYVHTTLPVRDPGTGRVIGAIEVGYDIGRENKLQREILKLNRKISRMGGAPESGHEAVRIVTRSPRMLGIIEETKRFARSSVPVMIYGETGTGKELFASLVHECSPRKGRPFVVLNCGALPEALIESTLFGTVKGAYTGAEDTDGLLSSADGGTLFLDEFNAMPPAMQVKLLRFLQGKTFTRVGDFREMRSDVRIVAALNEPPEKLIEEGRLRRDLFWRLAVAMVSLPPLRERREDIPLLAEHFLKKYASEIPYAIEGFAPKAVRALDGPWPGNVRMLENAVVRSMVLQGHGGPLEEIVLEDRKTMPARALGEEAPPPSAAEAHRHGAPLDEAVAAYERSLIVEALNETGGNVTAAAERLRVNRTTLGYKIRRHGIVLGVVR